MSTDVIRTDTVRMLIKIPERSTKMKNKKHKKTLIEKAVDEYL